EFMAAYKTALAGEDSPAREPKTRGEPGTFSRLAAQYFVSPDFLRLRTRTQHVYRLVIDRFLAEHGHRRVAEMRRDDVKKIMALKAATPGSANDLLKKVRRHPRTKRRVRRRSNAYGAGRACRSVLRFQRPA
ncbi:MAG: hypothetical protein WB677_26780, partial [Xanthobacteraceae bacterium]